MSRVSLQGEAYATKRKLKTKTRTENDHKNSMTPEEDSVHGICENCETVTDKKDLVWHFIEYMCTDCVQAFDKGIMFADLNKPKKPQNS